MTIETNTITNLLIYSTLNRTTFFFHLHATFRDVAKVVLASSIWEPQLSSDGWRINGDSPTPVYVLLVDCFTWWKLGHSPWMLRRRNRRASSLSCTHPYGYSTGSACAKRHGAPRMDHESLPPTFTKVQWLASECFQPIFSFPFSFDRITATMALYVLIAAILTQGL